MEKAEPRQPADESVERQTVMELASQLPPDFTVQYEPKVRRWVIWTPSGAYLTQITHMTKHEARRVLDAATWDNCATDYSAYYGIDTFPAEEPARKADLSERQTPCVWINEKATQEQQKNIAANLISKLPPGTNVQCVVVEGRSEWCFISDSDPEGVRDSKFRSHAVLSPQLARYWLRLALTSLPKTSDELAGERKAQEARVAAFVRQKLPYRFTLKSDDDQVKGDDDNGRSWSLYAPDGDNIETRFCILDAYWGQYFVNAASNHDAMRSKHENTASSERSGSRSSWGWVPLILCYGLLFLALSGWSVIKNSDWYNTLQMGGVEQQATYCVAVLRQDLVEWTLQKNDDHSNGNGADRSRAAGDDKSSIIMEKIAASMRKKIQARIEFFLERINVSKSKEIGTIQPIFSDLADSDLILLKNGAEACSRTAGDPGADLTCLSEFEAAQERHAHCWAVK